MVEGAVGGWWWWWCAVTQVDCGVVVVVVKVMNVGVDVSRNVPS